MEEGSTSEHHGELAGVVGVVEPGLVWDVPGVVAPREADDAIPGLPPDPANTELPVRHTPGSPPRAMEGSVHEGLLIQGMPKG